MLEIWFFCGFISIWFTIAFLLLVKKETKKAIILGDIIVIIFIAIICIVLGFISLLISIICWFIASYDSGILSKPLRKKAK